MSRRRIAALPCAFMTIAMLAACSHSGAHSTSRLSAAGGASPTVAPGPNPATASAPATSAASQTTAPAPGHTTKKSSAPQSSHSPSAGPDDTDYAVGWSNADCHWVVDHNGTAYVYARESITGSVPHTLGAVRTTVTSNGGGVPTVSELFSAAGFKPGLPTSFEFQVSAPPANFESHSITFTASLTFLGVPDQLAGDNTASLLIHFPATFVPSADGQEYLTCEHS